MPVWGRVSDPAAARKGRAFFLMVARLPASTPRRFAPRPGRRPGPTHINLHNSYPRTAANACFAAAIVRCTSSSVCVAPRNAASYCEGGRYTPPSSMPRKNLPKASVFDFDAESQSVTGPGVKNHVNIEPTRLWQSATPASFAAAATPSTNSPLNFSSRG